jgi:cell division protein FtsW
MNKKTAENNLQGLDVDRRVLLIFVVLTSIGVCLVASSSSFFAAAKFRDPYFLLKNHLIRVVVAICAMIIAMRIDYRFYRKPAIVGYIVAVGLLAGLFVAGETIRGTPKWYVFKSLHATLQPSELARLALVIFLAAWVTRVGKDIEDVKKGFLPAAGAVVAVVGLMVAQPNFGTATATALIALVILYVGGARLRHLAVFYGCMAVPVAVKLWTEGYARARLLAFFHHGEKLQQGNWQVYQSLIGLGSGGVFGSGFGESRQKLNWLPDSHTDFIFSILGEEAGLIGTVLVSAFFLFLVLRTIKISQKCGDVFGEMLAIGFGSALFIYAALNMAVATKLFPVTGLPLPFISFGGSALVVNSISIGILLNISKRSRRSARYTRLNRVV